MSCVIHRALARMFLNAVYEDTLYTVSIYSVLIGCIEKHKFQPPMVSPRENEVIMHLPQNSRDNRGMIISIFHGCMVWIEKSVTRVTDRHHEACRVMPNSDPE